MTKCRNVYIDECGYTGADLLQKDQPIFALAAVPIEECDACEIKKRYFPDLGVQELKHSKICGDDAKLDAVAGCLVECLNKGAIGVVFYKPFVCAETFLMDMVYPFRPDLRPGSDNFRVLAFNLMNAADWFGKKTEVELVLSAYVNACKILQKNKGCKGSKVDELYFPLYKAISSVHPSYFNDLLHPLRQCGMSYARKLAQTSCLSGCWQGAAFAIISQLEQQGFSYNLVVDTSPAIREVAPLFVSMKRFPSAKIRVSSDTELRFPLSGFKDVNGIDSKVSSGVQLADLVAGTLVRATYKRFGLQPKVSHERYDDTVRDIWIRYPMNMMVKPALEHVDVGADAEELLRMICSFGKSDGR